MSATPAGFWDAFGRRHPLGTWLLVVLLAIIVTIVLLYRDESPAVLYEGF